MWAAASLKKAIFQAKDRNFLEPSFYFLSNRIIIPVIYISWIIFPIKNIDNLFTILLRWPGF